jgi:hypothetical protein
MSSSTPPPLPPPKLQYYVPAPEGPFTEPFREGNLIVAPLLSTMPNCCFKCARPTSGRPLERKLYWHHPLFYLLLLGFPFCGAGIVLYVIVVAIVRKKATTYLFLCATHTTRRRYAVFVTGVLVAVSVALFLSGLLNPKIGGEVALSGLALLIPTSVFGMLATRITYAKKITDHRVLLAGAGQPFLDAMEPPPALAVPVPVLPSSAEQPGS